jgi:hypothetical protein
VAGQEASANGAAPASPDAALDPGPAQRN